MILPSRAAARLGNVTALLKVNNWEHGCRSVMGCIRGRVVGAWIVEKFFSKKELQDLSGKCE